MSMNTYPLEHSAAFFIDDDAATMILLQHDLEDNALSPALKELVTTHGIYKVVIEKMIPEDEVDEYSDTQYAMEILIDKIEETGFASEFEGEIQSIFPEKSETGEALEVNCSDDFITYIIPENEPSLFKKAYDSPDDLYREFKNKLEPYLPEEFPFWRNIVSIYGTYYC